MNKMDWKKYETEIFETFKTAYPNAKIKFNQKIIGRYSKVERQIDVLIEGRIAGRKIRLIIDGKYYSKNVDVKEVDSFISMIEDIDADQGILITKKGYSEAAINRAYYGPTDIELDILNFDELKEFQVDTAIPYSGWHGAVIPAPFGWIVDVTRRETSIANIYQRGKTYEEARKDGEYIYVNFFSFDEKLQNLDDVLTYQEEETLSYHPTAIFEYSDSIERRDEKRTLLRKILREETDLEEYTGFVEFDNFCVFCVLFTPEQLKSKNVRKLEYIIERLVPINVNMKSVALVRISELRELIENSDSEQEKAEMLISIAEIHQDMKELDEAKNVYKESIKIFPENYGAHLGLLEIGYNSSERDKLIACFYELAPGNISICRELVRLGVENDQVEYTEKLLLEKIGDEVENFESLGNIYFSIADLFFTEESMEIALKYFKLAKSNYEKCLEKNHPVFETIEKALTIFDK